ncbi:MAG: hypothetical protein K1X67_06730 [Fimbriimonadaceae bacterium]|nr:hypothetical protein [Fimbriimonadaceae bacterium]
MKLKLLIAGLALATAAIAQDTIDLTRLYKVGDVDKYKMDMKMVGQMGEVTVSLDLTQTIKKLYDNGDADIESQSGEVKIVAMGQNMNQPGGPATTQRHNKLGQPVGVKGGGQMDFMRFATFIGDGKAKVGETVTIDYKDAENPKNTAKGTVKIDSLENGVAKILIDLDVTSPNTGDKPMKMKMTNWYDVAAHKPNKMVGKITNLPQAGGMPMDSVDITMTRVVK